MLSWLKNNWKWLLGAVGTLGLSLLFKKQKTLRSIATSMISKIEEEVINNSHNQVVEGIEGTAKKHSNDVKAHNKANDAKKKAEDKKNNRKEELIKDSEKIDNELGKFGIKEVK